MCTVPASYIYMEGCRVALSTRGLALRLIQPIRVSLLARSIERLILQRAAVGTLGVTWSTGVGWQAHTQSKLSGDDIYKQ